MTRRTAYLGPPGTFSEEAAMRHDGSAELLPLASIAEVFDAVSSGRADQGVVPFESTLGGPVAATAELLVRRTGVVVRGQLDLPTDHCLVSRKCVGRKGCVLASAGAGRVPRLPGALPAAGRAGGLFQHRRRAGRHGALRAAGRGYLLSAGSRGKGRDYRGLHPGQA